MVKNILDQAADLGCLSVRLTGGEPLLRTDFAEIYLYARKKGIKVSLFTNATLITDELTALLKRYPPDKPVEITLYGMKQKSYEAVSRVTGSFAAAMRGVAMLTKSRLPLLLKFVHLPHTETEIDDFRRFAKQHTVGGRAGVVTLELNLRARRDSHEKNRHIKQLRTTSSGHHNIPASDAEAYRKDMQNFARTFMRPGGTNLFDCGCGKGGSVDAYGTLQPCLLMRHPELTCDLKNGTIEDALDRFFPEALQQQAENPLYLERCAKCFLKGLCSQCPAWSWMEHGDLDTPVDYLCHAAHEKARYLGLIEADENAWMIKNWKDRITAFVQK
jgi:radical SAM protein with 4Fe4S-binding SPASM domain